MAGVSMEKFEEYFQKADVDRDGQISGAEAVAFLQIWMHADQNRIGFLSRPKFYNALGLVTVSQSKRELKQDIVKAALYGHASAKITPPSPPPPLPNKCICYSWATAKSSSCFTFDTGGCNFPSIFSKSRGSAPPSSSINQQPGTVLSTSGMHQQLQPVSSSTGMNQQFGSEPTAFTGTASQFNEPTVWAGASPTKNQPTSSFHRLPSWFISLVMPLSSKGSGNATS